jgi:diguanylate cyclase (GGDEF)-like protein
VVANFLRNPAAGATTARKAARSLDDVISATNRLRNVGINQMQAEEIVRHVLHNQLKRDVMLVMAFGSLAVLLSNMLIGWRISSPLRKLTAAMTRLAERDYDLAIPATIQRDEVGSMSRAVMVFREGLIRAVMITAELEATKTLLDTVMENVPIPIIVKDAANLCYVLINPAAAKLLPDSPEISAGVRTADVLPPEEAALIETGDRAALQSGGLTMQRDIHLGASTPYARIVDVLRMVVNGQSGEPRYLISVVQDITERRQSEQRLAHMAQYDTLTDLPNRTLFADRLTEALRAATETGGRIAVLGLDLDRFKEVNDTLGHAAGDILLCKASERVRRCLRSGDTLARLGGDEFAVIQQNIRSAEDPEALASRLIDAVRIPFDIEGQMVIIGLSAGIALSDDAVSAAELVQRADLALYDAKQAGRGVSRFFAPKLSERMRERRTMEQDLRSALKLGQLSLHYQPSVSLRSGAIVGSEALMRWMHPTAGSVPPSTFIPLAEETGLINPLGLWLLNEACREAAGWALPIRVAVNVSPVQFRAPGFPAHVREALHSSGLAPGRLELEITEGVLMRGTAETTAILDELRDTGVRIALDDFGTGYASLAYLQTFTFDKLKIDRSFVMNIETDPTALAIMRAVLGLTDSLNMTTTAEGIEMETQADLLRILGCDEAQGYLFWRPMPAAALRGILQDLAKLARIRSENQTVDA